MNDSADPKPADAPPRRRKKKKQKRPVKVWLPPTALTVTTWVTILFILVLPLRPITTWPPGEYLLWPDALRLANLLLVLLFLPLGFFEGWTGASLWRPSTGVLVIVMLDATFLSGVAELLQWVIVEPEAGVALFNRDSSILDMLLCISGSVLGGTVGLKVGPRINRALWGAVGEAKPAE